ncbi:hypothetical protein ACJ41O_007010 [Fusarium nematophilum]
MGDASCSGGTPFKRLIDHQSRDVSHHQDRLVDRAGPQGHASFRSTPQPMQGPDGFGAFMDGPSTLPGIPHHHAAGRLAAHAAVLEQGHAPAFHPAQTPQFQGQQSPAVDVSNWAADFNRFATQNQQRQPLQNSFPQAAPQIPLAQPTPQMNFQAAFVQPNASFSPLYGQANNSAFMGPNATTADFDDEMSKWMTTNAGGGNMEQVDAMMDQMARELELNEAALAEAEAASKQETAPEPQIEDTMVQPAALETPDIANLSLENTSEPVESEPADSAAKTKSDVADAAERLLESVQHEDGEKWKNSVFLSLMRDFRDGRKDIVDNEIRETPENEADASKAAQ